MREYLTNEGIKFLEIAKKHKLKDYADVISGSVIIELNELNGDLKISLVNMLLDLEDDNMVISQNEDYIILGPNE